MTTNSDSSYKKATLKAMLKPPGQLWDRSFPCHGSAAHTDRVLPSRARALPADPDPEEQLQAGLPHLTGLNSLRTLSRAWKESDGRGVTGLQNPEWKGNERAPTTNLINGSEGWNLIK